MTRRAELVRRVGRLAAALLLVPIAGGCADVVDTELGLDARIEDASLEVSGADVSGTFRVSYRVGEHASGVRSFQPRGVDLFVDGSVVATMDLEPPADFDPVIAPGESREVTFGGAAAGVTDPMVLCGATVTLVLRWTDGSTSELGMFETTTENVTCL